VIKQEQEDVERYLIRS